MSFIRVAGLASRRALVGAPRRVLGVRNVSNEHPSTPPPPAKIEHPGVESEPPHDQTTSAFTIAHTLTPEDHIHDGVVPAGIVSGAPIELQTRTCRIYKPTKAATQSSNWHGHQWRMDWDVLSKGHRWENPLMGWQSSADFMQGTHISFNTKEEAIYFAEKQGYEWYIQEPKEREIKPKAYANNFTWSGKKLKNIHTK